MSNWSDLSPSVFFSDLDGTLLRSDQTVSRYTRATIYKCIELGYPFIPVTARSSVSAATAMSWLRAPVPMICQNGAILYDMHARGILESIPIRDDVRVSLLKHLRQEGIPTIGDSDTYKYVEHGAEKLRSMLPPGPSLAVHTMRQVRAPLYTLIVERSPRAEALLPSLAAEFEDLRFVASSAFSIDVTSVAANKLAAVSKLCETYEISLPQACAFGDGDNDVGMLKLVGHGVAVANATLRLRSAARYVLNLSNDEDAVASFVEGVIMST